MYWEFGWQTAALTLYDGLICWLIHNMMALLGCQRCRLVITGGTSFGAISCPDLFLYFFIFFLYTMKWNSVLLHISSPLPGYSAQAHETKQSWTIWTFWTCKLRYTFLPLSHSQECFHHSYTNTHTDYACYKYSNFLNKKICINSKTLTQWIINIRQQKNSIYIH